MEQRTIAIIVTYNESAGIGRVLERLPESTVDKVIVVNDGSTDDTPLVVERFGVERIDHPRKRGVGAAIKSGIRYGLDRGFDIGIVLAGNGKDDPREIPRLLKPIIEDDYKYVQGSRYLPGGKAENLPQFRRIMVPIHAFIFRVLTGCPCTDALNGFRAFKLNIFEDPRINIWQSWLDRYEYETYVHYLVLKLGYKVKEVPVSKIYPPMKSRKKYSHIRPIIDWWSIMRPLFYLKAGLRK